MIHNLTRVKEFDAYGGPAVKKMGPDGYEMTPTEGGRYIVGKIEKHISSGKYLWSGVPWGAGLKFINNVTYVDVKNNGLWDKLSHYKRVWLTELKTEAAITKAIKDQWEEIRFISYSGQRIPVYQAGMIDHWLFNDFGHISIKYFADSNHNYVRDGNETLLGDFIHTTPFNEGLEFYNNHRKPGETKFKNELFGSHGCIHVKPSDIDTMIGTGYIKVGNAVVIHSYNEKRMPMSIKPSRYTRKGFEVHFFPGLNKIRVYQLH